VPIADWRSLLMGGWQRAQLAALARLSDHLFASIEAWTHLFGRRPAAHLPSGSNLPDARERRQAMREELGLDGSLAVATLSSGHPSHLTDYVGEALRRLVTDGVSPVFLQLGAGSSGVEGIPATVRVVRPGPLPAERLAEHVAAADMLLAPFVDGVSTRRSSLMAALQQGVAVVGTRGALTDPCLLRLELVNVGDEAAFAEHVSAVATSRGRCERLGESGRELFERSFAWSAIATRLLRTVGAQPR
jgi:glycosyltransferase involved in cell wall biosynthesis